MPSGVAESINHNNIGTHARRLACTLSPIMYQTKQSFTSLSSRHGSSWMLNSHPPISESKKLCYKLMLYPTLS